MMPLFNKKILQQALNVTEIPVAHLSLLQQWQQRIRSRELEKQHEVALQGVFIQLLIEILGYEGFGHSDSYTLAREYPIARGAVDVALGQFSNTKQGDTIQAVLELKGAKTKNLDAIMSGRLKTPVQQAWEYARDAKGCQWVLVSNYVEMRLYAVGETSLVYEAFEFAKLTDPTEYARFLLCLQAENLLGGHTKALLAQSQQAEKDITNQLYADYKALREQLITRLMVDNPDIAPLDLIAPAQKLLDRVLFVAFAEDKGLIPAKSIEKAYQFSNPYEDPKPKYHNFKGLFNAINKGREALKVFGYNGGLFAADKLIDRLNVADELCQGFLQLADYDFASEISVTVLGHIFEQSIADLEEITEQIQQDGILKVSAKTSSVSGKRKQHGIVYTPDHITAFIVEHTVVAHLQQRFSACLTEFATLQADNSLQWHKGKQTELRFWYAWQAVLKTIKIVDPACGSGAFLVAAFDVLYAEYVRTEQKIAELTDKPNAGLFDLNKEILNSNLSGVDINPESIEITKLSLWLKTAEKGKKLATIDQHLQVGNSLGVESPVPLNLPGLQDLEGFCWQKQFAKIMHSGGFDVVLGNPPYVRQELFSTLKPYLQQHYAVYHGVADLYAYFFELGLKILKPNGMLGFISSSTFFKTSSAEPLRRFLSENATLKKVVDFGDLQVFEGVTTYPAILIFQNSPPQETSEIKMLALKDKLPEKLSKYFMENHGLMHHAQLRSDSWQLEDARLTQLFDKLTQGYPTLKAVYGSPYRGVLTGLNEAFVIDGATKTKLIQQDIKSAEILKQFLEGKDLKKWHSQARDLWLIFTRRGIDIENYPAIKAHLEQYRIQLEPKPIDFPKNETWLGRKEGKYKWFEIQDPIAYYKEFEKPKIQYGHFCAKALFHCNANAYYSNDKSYIIASDDSFLLGLLNSKLFWQLIISLCPFVRGGYYELRAQYIETLPIPPASEEQKTHIGQLAAQCQTLSEARYRLEKSTQLSISELGIPKLTRKLEQAWALDFKDFLAELSKQKIDVPLKKHSEWRDFLHDTKIQHEEFNQHIAQLEQQLNQAVYALFDLTAAEIALVENK
jgi:type I restriction-modification system DNA methylase subunit